MLYSGGMENNAYEARKAQPGWAVYHVATGTKVAHYKARKGIEARALGSAHDWTKRNIDPATILAGRA